MIRTLQKKFIVTAMIAVTVLLAVLLGAVNVVNAWSTNRDAARLLDALVQMEAEGRNGFRPGSGDAFPGQADEFPSQGDFPAPDGFQPGGAGSEDDQLPPEPPDGRPGGRGGFLSEDLTDNDRMSAVYFTVRALNGSVISADVSRISSVTEEDACAMCETVLAGGKAEGRTESFRYASQDNPEGQTVFVFLENSARRNSVLRVAVLSALAGLVGWGLMLLLVVLLSKKAIRPIAANMERQRQFVTDAGHELKTPLAIIQANTEAMELIAGETKWSRNIKVQVARLSDLTKNLLTLARAEETPNEAGFTQTDFSALVNQTVQMFREPMELRGLTLDASIAPDLALNGNQSQLATLCSILTDNAVKYAAEGSTIRLELKKADKSLCLRLENDCEHRPDCAPDRLFDRFFRADAARTQSTGGSGIGLSAARVIAVQHRGQLSAEYVGERSIAFILTLPLN